MSKSRKRKRPGGQTAGRVKKSIILSAELAQRLEVYAAACHKDQSDVVAEALEPVLAGFGWFTRASGPRAASSEPARPMTAPQPPASQAAA